MLSFGFSRSGRMAAAAAATGAPPEVEPLRLPMFCCVCERREPKVQSSPGRLVVAERKRTKKSTHIETLRRQR